MSANPGRCLGGSQTRSSTPSQSERPTGARNELLGPSEQSGLSVQADVRGLGGRTSSSPALSSRGARLGAPTAEAVYLPLFRLPGVGGR